MTAPFPLYGDKTVANLEETQIGKVVGYSKGSQYQNHTYFDFIMWTYYEDKIER